MSGDNYYWVENPRWRELQDALTAVRQTNSGIADVLSGVQSAMEAGAWEGGTAEDFLGGLDAENTRATGAGEASEGAVVEALDGVPDQVKRYYDAMVPE